MTQHAPDRAPLIRLLQHLKGWRLSMAVSGITIGCAELVVSAMDLILNGEITAHYLLTGLVAA